MDQRIEHELARIAQLGLAEYLLIIRGHQRMLQEQQHPYPAELELKRSFQLDDARRGIPAEA
jgi:hypothetical protein